MPQTLRGSVRARRNEGRFQLRTSGKKSVLAANLQIQTRFSGAPERAAGLSLFTLHAQMGSLHSHATGSRIVT